MPPHNIPQTISQCDRQQHEVNHHSCVLALTISSVFSVRNAQAMATLEELESLLNEQLLSEIVQQQEYDDVSAKEELLAALQRACSRGSGADVQTLSALADMLRSDEVATQDAVDIIQAQGLFDMLETVNPLAKAPASPLSGPKSPSAPTVKKVLQKEMQKEIKEELKEKAKQKLAAEIINNGARAGPTPLTSTKRKALNLVNVLKGAVKSKPQQLLDMLTKLQSINELANEEDYRDNVAMEDYSLFDDVAMEDYDLLNEVDAEDYEGVAAEGDKARSSNFMNMLGGLLG